MRIIIRSILIIIIVISAPNLSLSQNNLSTGGDPEPISYLVTVYDSASLSPLADARITIRQNKREIETEITDPKGLAKFTIPKEGIYSISIYASQYNEKDTNLSITSQNSSSTFFLSIQSFTTEEIEVVGERQKTSTSEISSITGAQIYNADITPIVPTARITNLISENLAGAVIAPTGEVHIRGQHGEYQYIVDGMPVTLGVFGGLNEIVDPKVVDRIRFLTGGFSAEYGGQMSAVIDVQNRVPPGKFHLDFSTYVGSYLVFNGASPFKTGANVYSGQSSSAPGDTLGGTVGPFRSLNSNGQALSLSGHVDRVGYFFSASRQETDRRIDPPTATLFNDLGTDYFLYGKIDYTLNKNDFLTLNMNYGHTNTQVPFDSIESGYSPDQEGAYNAFQTLSYTHIFSDKENHQSKLFVGFIGRQGQLSYTPSDVSPVTFQFAGDSTLYALSETRQYQSYGTKVKYDITFSKFISGFTGINFTATTGSSNFTSRDSVGNAGPSEYDAYKGSDFGVFAGLHINPVKRISLDLGARYDQHIEPDVGLTRQVSPRVKLNFLFDKFNSGYIYYGRLFMPTNIEAIKAIASNVINVGGLPTLPERDSFYEAVYIHKFTFGLSSKAAFYYKDATPGVDDETIGASAIKTPVNIAEVKTTGIELSLTYQNPKKPWSGYLNAAICHAYGLGAVTGGFLPVMDDGSGTDLDHDQRLTISGGVTYHPANWFIDISSDYGSGLTNGDPSGAPFNLGLFDFNSAAHVSPWIVFDLGGGYTFKLGKGVTLQPSLYVNNILDNSYLLKGAYFSSASYGERRNVVLKLDLHM